MSKSINVSWPGVDPEALKRKAAERGIREAGSPWSTSEYIRRAVEAYSEQEAREDAPKAPRGRGVRKSDSAVVLVPPREATSNAAPREEINPDVYAETHRVRSQALDTALSHAEEIDSVIPPFRPTPFPKSAQLGKKK